MPSEQIELLIQMGSTLLHPDIGVEELRTAIRDIVAARPAIDGEVVTDAGTPVPGGLWIRHASVGPEADAVVLWVHGGGYVAGEPQQMRGMATALSARTGARVLVPAYRVAPEHAHPAALDDAVAAYRWLLGTGVGPDRVVVGGDSAGGGLVLAMVLALRDAGEPLPAGIVTFSAWTDLAITGETLETRKAYTFGISEPLMRRCAAAYLGGGDARHPYASPLYGDWRGVPPMLVHAGDHEVLLADSTRMAERAEAAGVDVTLRVWPEMPHVHQSLVGAAPEAEEAIDDAARFVRARLHLALPSGVLE